MPHKLLLADDSITIQKVVELVLAEEDFEIMSVGNGEDALKVLTTFMPEVVLADIEMPKMNGYQLCEKIKQNPATAHVPVILLAGAFEPVDDAVARKVGADDSVIKPFESQELISKLNAALTLSASASAAEAVPAEEEAFAIAEEAVEIGEEPAVALEAEAEAVPAAEEDLWAMEEISEAQDEVPAEVQMEEESPAGAEEAFEIAEEEPAEAAEEDVFAIADEEPAAATVAEEAFGLAEEEPFAVAAEEAAVPGEEPFAMAEEEIPAAPVFGEVVAPPRPQPVRESVPPRESRIPEPVAAPVAMPQAGLPSREEFLAVYKKTIDEKVTAALASLDMKESLIRALMPSLKDSVEKILWEIAPDLTEKMLKEILKGSIASLTSQVEKVIWETVPDLASTMISKEIERIKSEF